MSLARLAEETVDAEAWQWEQLWCRGVPGSGGALMLSADSWGAEAGI